MSFRTSKYRKMKNILKYLILIFFPLTIQAQRNFSVKIQFPKNINSENIRIGYENGKERISFPTKFIDNKITMIAFGIACGIALSRLKPFI